MTPTSTKIQIDQFVTTQSSISRRKLVTAIASGQVTVNGVVIESRKLLIQPEKDRVIVAGEPISFQNRLVYFKFYKPKHIECTLNPTREDRDIRPFLSKIREPVVPVGRLDRQSTGLLILTNDGKFANFLAHPTHKVPKTYLVEIDRPISETDARALVDGFELDDGRVAFEEVTTQGSPKLLVVKIAIGRNRIVRRAFAHLHYDVKRLKRTAIGSIQLGRMAPGELKPLTRGELSDISYALTGRAKSSVFGEVTAPKARNPNTKTKAPRAIKSKRPSQGRRPSNKHK